jgi:hypothetical protein
MAQKALKTHEIVQSGASYAVGAGGVSYVEWGDALPPPAWMQEWTHVFEFGIVFFGFVIVVLTALWNLKRVIDVWSKND